jgi:thiamine biosynthesis protein ThiI
MDNLITIHYSEIALKGGNRPFFIDTLIKNIRYSLEDNLLDIESSESRIFLKVTDKKLAFNQLSNVFGIANFSDSVRVSRDIEDITNAIKNRSHEFKDKTIKIHCARSDKKYPLTSPQINIRVGSSLEEAGFNIDLEAPQKIIHIQILRDSALVHFDKIPGMSGLPVGTSGSVLSLLSGGIDSPVSSWCMMRRGCKVDYLHVHASPTSSDVIDSKIPKVIEQLRKFHPQKSRLFIAPYHEFLKKTNSINPKAELVVFRRFIIRLASAIAKEHDQLGIVTGDNLGQVASQTLENLLATSNASDLPIYRPLITYDKQEIISLSKKIGTHDLSIEEYKDCCSLVAMKHPSTKVKLEVAQDIEEKIEIEKIVEKTMDQIEILEI